mmetsp:Transcript_40650/g.121247  ORF Transcript_40650/g.121247 Transcript_40650/m.121247 type:complete len:235 (-) Transcript_40650:1430-2134(-)
MPRPTATPPTPFLHGECVGDARKHAPQFSSRPTPMTLFANEQKAQKWPCVCQAGGSGVKSKSQVGISTSMPAGPDARACVQFRALSNELFGTPAYHELVRSQVIRHLRAHRGEFAVFLGEDFDEYLAAMSRPGTWGDELTLRAASDSYGALVRCITSEDDNWYITYEPHQVGVEWVWVCAGYALWVYSSELWVSNASSTRRVPREAPCKTAGANMSWRPATQVSKMRGDQQCEL